MTALPLDVWIMMLFSAAVFFGGSLWMLIYTLRQEDRKLRILREHGALDTYAPAALRDLRAWIEAHPNDLDVDTARRRYDECVEALRSTDEHVYDWSEADLNQITKA
ncbi:MAG: hypothetical protein BRD55_09180 [Bacteroidetes bacterium SW_9_63_38]|nr:MAG: hypothetical protein BRD55_09180 [Bacteroidetes bacterium SW_9_63_38]